MKPQTVRTPVLETAYFEAGPATGDPVILLHGWPDDAGTWRDVTHVLTSAGHRVVAPYLRGCGPTRFLSPDIRRSGQLSALGQDVVDIVNALGLNKVALVGHDWGARAAAIATTELQTSGRVTHLVLMSVGYGTNNPATSAGKERFFVGMYGRTLLPGVGHFPQREAPALTAQAIVEWLGAFR